MSIHRRHRRGVVYLTVLSVSMIVVVIGVGSLLVVRQQSLANEGVNDSDKARMAARSGIEMARYLIAADPSWRTNRSSGTWVTNQLVGDASFSLDVIDSTDGNLSNVQSDSVLITATGRCRAARQMMQATLTADCQPLSCLGAALTVNGAINVKGYGICSDQLVSSNSTISGTSALNSDAEATLITVPGSGTRRNLSAPRVLPASTAFDYYIAVGTFIDPSKKLKSIALSATSNPYGAPNPLGIYVIDCGGAKYDIEDCLINATVVLLNPKSDSSAKGPIQWRPATANLPALMVQGAYTFAQDAYPNRIEGLTYISGDLKVNTPVTFNAPLIVGGKLDIGAAGGGLTLSYDGTCQSTPPQGFYTLPAPLKPLAGSWKPIVSP